MAITFIVFGQTVHYDFVNFDDDIYVFNNPFVALGLTWKGFCWAFSGAHAGNWHPLTWLSHMLDCQIYGLNAGGHHFTSVLLHAATAILLFLVLRQMTGALWRSAFVAAVFVIHPLRAESVAWVAERKDVLSGLFFMLTLLAYVRYVKNQSRLEKAQKVPASNFRFWNFDYCLVLLFFALGLLSKPMLVTLPFVLLLLDYWPLGRSRNHGSLRLIVEKLPLLGLTIVLCIITFFAQKGGVLSLPLPWRIGNALVSYVTYLGQMIWPAGLAAFYPHPGNSLKLWKIFASAALLLIITAATVAARKKRPYLLFGWLWYLGMLVPVIGIMQVGLQAHADRYTYLPQIGLCIALTWAAVDLTMRWRYHQWMLGVFTTVVVLALIFCARTQVAYWRNNESLWTQALACTSGNFIAHNNLGYSLYVKGDVSGAMTHYKQALEFNPDYPEAEDNLGIALFHQGEVDEAIVHYEKAVQLDPSNAEAQNNLGNALFQKGQIDEAIAHCQKALEINPDFSEAHDNLGNALLQKGKVDEAIAQFQLALQLKPDSAEANNNFGNALLQQGKASEALAHFQKSLQINPGSAEAENNVGYALLAMGNVDDAIIHFQKGITDQTGHPERRE